MPLAGRHHLLAALPCGSTGPSQLRCGPCAARIAVPQRERYADEVAPHTSSERRRASANARRTQQEIDAGRAHWCRRDRRPAQRSLPSGNFAVPAALGMRLQLSVSISSLRAHERSQACARNAASSLRACRRSRRCSCRGCGRRPRRGGDLATQRPNRRPPPARVRPSAPAPRRRPSPARRYGRTPGRPLQAPGQLRRHGAQLHGVAARLEHRQDAFAAPALGSSLRRRPSIVVRIAVGWWAKSS